MSEIAPPLAPPACAPPRTGRDVAGELAARFPGSVLGTQPAAADPQVVWVGARELPGALRYLKDEAASPFPTLFDLAAVDERTRGHREGLPASDFTLAYHLLSLARDEDVVLKVPLTGERPRAASVTGVFPSANWYEREAFDMFGIAFDGHPDLRRILLPPEWEGHPLRKEYPARATDLPPFRLPGQAERAEEEALRFRPERWGLHEAGERRDTDFMFLNVGPQHPGTHGLLRVVLELDGEEIVNAVLDIGYHHRGAEKMAERQSWHTYIPYTDRVEYLSGALNNMPYLLAVERLAGIEVPDRAQVIRVMLSELFRISSHLVFYGTFAQDVGAMSPVFYTFEDRERVLGIVEAVCGARMHPNWFRIGGVAQDLPDGWDELVLDLCDYLPARLDEYDRVILGNPIFRARTKGVGAYSLAQAQEWGVTGPGLRACGLEYDLRKKRPYSGYDAFEFEVPTATGGDCYDRAWVRVQEMRQSLRIVRQCVGMMPPGPYVSEHHLAVPPLKARTMLDIETLITHFLGVSWGPVIPPGEAAVPVEASKGITQYWLVSDGASGAYRARVRTPSFPHLQMLPEIARGRMIPDLLAILGSVDFVLSDVDR